MGAANNITLVEYFNTIFGDLPKGETAVLGTPNPGGGWYHYPATTRKLEQVEKRAKTKALYTCVSTVDASPLERNEKLTRTKDACRFATVVMLDDIGTKVGKPPLEPSFILETSKGNFQYVYLIEPHELHTQEQIDYYEACMRGIVEAGYGDKGCIDVARMYRIPGSINTKPGKDSFETRITHWEPSRYWELQKLMEELGVKPKFEKDRVANKPSGLTLEDEYEDGAVKWLEENDLILAPMNSSGWLSIKCPWHAEHSDGRIGAYYSPAGVGSMPHTRGFKCQHEHCKKRNSKKFLDWIREQGGPFFGVWVFEQAVIKIAAQGKFGILDPRRPWKQSVLSRDGLKMEYSIGDATLGDIIKDSNVRTAVDTFYHPGKPIHFTDADGYGWYNTYRHPAPHFNQTEPHKDYVPELLLQLCKRIAPGKHETVLLDWLANLIQRPGNRSYALLGIGREGGEGKSFFGKLASTLVGMGNAANESLKDLFGKDPWADMLEGKTLIVVSESKDLEGAGEWYRIYEHIKRVIDTSPEKATGNFKRKGIRDYIIWANFLFFSNHTDAIRLDSTDRRFYVFEAADDLPQNPELFNALEQLIRGEGPYEDGAELAQMYHWLKARKITTDLKNPPMTAEKQELIEEVRGELESQIIGIIQSLPGELITPAAFTDQIVKRLGPAHDTDRQKNQLRAAIRQAKKSFKYKRTKHFRYYTIRNGDKWTGASKADIEKQLDKNEVISSNVQQLRPS